MTDYPTGLVPLVEGQETHADFVKAANPNYAVVNMVYARQAVKRGETAADYFGDQTSIICTSTVRDEKLDLISWEDEREIVREFEPDFHVPTDYSIYFDMEKDERIGAIEECMRGTVWMSNELADDDVTLLPLVKGLTEEERQVCYESLEQIGTDYAVFYGTQFFSGGAGMQIAQLKEIIGEIDKNRDFDMLLMGLLSPRYLAQMPDSIVAASGMNQWRKACRPRSSDADEIRESYDELAANVEEALEKSPDEDDE